MEQHHFDIVNHATPRLESMDKALGRGKYTDDLELPNMAYAALVRCPYSHAKVLSIDVSEAEKVPGYLGCALPEEAPQAYFNCSGNPPSPLLMADEKVLTTEPLTIGDRVAVVAAETEEAARAAAEAAGESATAAGKNASAAQANTPAAAPKPAEGKKTKEQKRAEAQARAALNKKLKGVRNQLKKIEAELDKKRARYDELMELMASEELYADQDKFNAALGEYNGLKQELPKLEDEWLELSTQIEEETARELS